LAGEHSDLSQLLARGKGACKIDCAANSDDESDARQSEKHNDIGVLIRPKRA